MHVTITIYTSTGAYPASGGYGVVCDDYAVSSGSHGTEIRLLKTVDDKKYIVRQFLISTEHSYELVVTE